MDRTNVTDTGYTYNGQNYTKQSRTDSQGNSYTVDVPTAISTASLAPAPAPISVTQPNYNVGGYQADGAKASSYLQSSFDTAQAEADKINKEGLDQSNTITTLMNELGGKSAALDEAYNQKDENGNSVFSLSGQLRKLNAEAYALNTDNLAKTLAETNKATGQNITSAAVQRNTADATRENTIKLAGVAMRAALAKADYDTAKEMKDSQVNAKYDGILGTIMAKQNNLQALKDFKLAPAQQKRLDAQTALLKKQEQEALKRKEDEKTIGDLIINANSQNAPKDIVNRATKAMQEGKSPLEVANILGVYAGDYRKALLLDEQLKTEKAQQANIYANMAKTKLETSQLSNPSGIPSKPLTAEQAKDLTYAQRGDQAGKVIDNLSSKITSMSPSSFTSQKLLEANSLTSGNVSPEIRQVRQAERNFATAILRRESGAAISASEFATVEKQYFPRPGDDTQTLAQKKQNRETAISSFKSNVPGYDARVATPESSYVDQALNAATKVDEQTNNPYSNYVVGLQVRNGK